MKILAVALSAAVLSSLSPLAAAQQAKPGSTFRDCPTCPEMVVLPAGEFTMGSPKEESGQVDEKPLRKVTFTKAFAMSKFEITFDQWDACTAEGGCPKADDEGAGRADRPAFNVSWVEVHGFAAWLSKKTGKKYRMPTEAEWEYAARAGTSTPWHFGTSSTSAGSPEACKYGNVHDQASSEAHPMYVWSNHPCNDGFPETAPVGKYQPNPWGLHDMVGNVREWVQDCHLGDYSKAPTDGGALDDPKCEKRIVRGGGWIDGFQSTRSAYRHTYEGGGEFRGSQVGFRLVREM